MSPTGLLIVILLTAQINESLQFSITSTFFEAVTNGSIVISLDVAEACDPGEYLENGECTTCKGYGDPCTFSKQCCKAKRMTCSRATCDCDRYYEWNAEKEECDFIETTTEEIIFIVGLVIVLPFSLVIGARLCKLGLKRIRKYQNSRAQPSPSPDGDSPDQFSSLPRSSAPAFVSALRDLEYSENERELAYPAPEREVAYPEPEREVAYPPPAYIIPQEAWEFDKPPDYEDLPPVAVSPPPHYDQAIPGGTFVFPSSQVTPP